MKLKILFLVFAVASAFPNNWDEWENYKKTYQKVYKNNNDENYRSTVFSKNLEQIEHHNSLFAEGLITYRIGVNHNADYTHDELILPSLSSPSYTKRRSKEKALIPTAKVPESIDWRDYGVITPIEDQKLCSTCWAFATVATLEAHMNIYSNKKNISLSVENLSDCVYQNFICSEPMNTTALEDTLEYILNNRGIDTADSYPYDEQTYKCRFNEEYIGAKIKDYVTLPPEDEEQLKIAVGTVGPVSVLITTDWTFSLYQTGVYYNENCLTAKEKYNHAVSVVGYGNEEGQDYWLVKNSYGDKYGEDGYIKMARNRDNACGIATFTAYPIIDDE